MHSLSPGRCQWCIKHATEQCGVGQTLLHWNYQRDASCPRCTMLEDTCHVLQCLDIEATSNWHHDIYVLDTLLRNTSTLDDLWLAIISCLQTWCIKAPLIDEPTWTPTLHLVITTQDSIGWKPLLKGLPSKHGSLTLLPNLMLIAPPNHHVHGCPSSCTLSTRWPGTSGITAT